MAQVKLKCGVTLVLVPTGPDHKTKPNEYFWQVLVDSNLFAQGYHPLKSTAFGRMCTEARKVIRSSEFDLNNLTNGSFPSV